MDPLSPVSSQYTAQTSVSDALASRATSAAAGAKTDKVKSTAQQFEAFFVGQMMEYMSDGLKADGVFGGGQAENTWRSMLNQEYGKQVAKSGKLGISDTVMTSMLQAQEKRSAAQNAQQEAQAAATDDTTNDDLSASASAAALAAGTTARTRSIVA